ncbi:hypothetical protein [Sulfobacillus thermosulfidooxidans]|uniref:non-homologous end-joining DNA ligase LigD n=1 Tax=Sulfobacillus thermosulfidooxidans TaxID=28034 RepID=UPI0006B58DE2|nr:hypothetical protein [Sulfobacillus thermosulfidooxidans]
MVEFVNGEHRISLHVSHPERVLFPDIGVTRLDLLDYYAAVSSVILPHYSHRALTVKRWPHGIGGPMFYQKHERTRTNASQMIQIHTSKELLQWVALGVIEWHVPLALIEEPDLHDWAVFDLDPHEVGWEKVAEATRIMAKLLELLRLPYLLKTSGHNGMHIYMRIEPESYEIVTTACRLIAEIAVKTYPHLFTTERLKVRRGQRVYIDFLQNGYHRTMAGVYSVRAVKTASVSCPVMLDEVDILPTWWTMPRVIERIGRYGDLFGVFTPAISLRQHLEAQGIMVPLSLSHSSEGEAK